VETKKKQTLLDEVRDVVKLFNNNEFSVAYVEAAMKKLGMFRIDTSSNRQ
jgi:hypothetical protein